MKFLLCFILTFFLLHFVSFFVAAKKRTDRTDGTEHSDSPQQKTNAGKHGELISTTVRDYISCTHL